VGDFHSIEVDRTAPWVERLQQEAQQSTLADAAGTEKHQTLAGPDGQIEIDEKRFIAKM
jgi:hypothetical protein